MQTPTHEAYNELQTAFDHFNKTLYGGVLKLPMFTLPRLLRATPGPLAKQWCPRRWNGHEPGVLLHPLDPRNPLDLGS